MTSPTFLPWLEWEHVPAVTCVKRKMDSSKPVVLNLWREPPGQPTLPWVAFQVPCISNIYLTIHNSSKNTVMQEQQK